jgi:Rieske Fe-S protein
MKPIITLDIETLGTPGKSNFVAMPSFAFARFDSFDSAPMIIRGHLNKEKQIAEGALVTGSTINFWMGLAAKGSTTAIQIMKDSSSTLGSVLVAGTTDDGLIDHLTDLQVFNTAYNVLATYNVGLFYGNGPEFDMSIYKAHCEHLGAPIPWDFWQLGNVRTLRDLYVEHLDNPKAYKDLEQMAEEYAHKWIMKLDLMAHDVFPTKHDPVFDALVEAFQIASIKAHFGI